MCPYEESGRCPLISPDGYCTCNLGFDEEETKEELPF